MGVILVTALYAAVGMPLIIQAMESRKVCEEVAASNSLLPQVVWSRCLMIINPTE